MKSYRLFIPLNQTKTGTGLLKKRFKQKSLNTSGRLKAKSCFYSLKNRKKQQLQSLIKSGFKTSNQKSKKILSDIYLTLLVLKAKISLSLENYRKNFQFKMMLMTKSRQLGSAKSCL